MDGQPGGVPISLPVGPQSHTLVFQADGYAAMTRTLDATKSRTLVLGMQRRLAPPAATTPPPPTADRPAKATAKPSGKRPGGKRGRATDLFLDI